VEQDAIVTSPDAVGTPQPRGVRLRAITKTYGAVTACRGVDLDLIPGEVHGLLGENGAGKSTLMKVLIGLVLPDEGEVLVDGNVTHITDPIAAAALGIGMVHQHFSLVPALTVWENVILGERGRLDRAGARAVVHELGERYRLEIDPDARVADLPVGQRQRVEIIKCLRRDPRVLVLDEPTSVLTPQESRHLFDVLREAVERDGLAVALVSHKLEEIRRATDKVTIMRAGRVVAHGPTRDHDDRSLAREMVGREVALRDVALLGSRPAQVEEIAEEPEHEVDHRGTAALRIKGLVVAGEDGRRLLDGLDLDVWPGEIVGLAGVEGNGQSALGDICSSLLPADAGTVEVEGTAVHCGRHGAMAASGLGVIPEDRHRSGCVLDMSVAENLVMDHPELVARRGMLDRRKLRAHAQRLIDEFEISCPGPDAPMWQLSGGNQQRVVLARELSRRPAVLVAAQPTRGLDVGAVEYMAARLRTAAEEGAAVLLISTELEEILDLADRVVVIHRGRITGEMARADVDVERLGLLMGGEIAA
jgi:general nucleoside transport system ATP-binding protein